MISHLQCPPEDSLHCLHCLSDRPKHYSSLSRSRVRGRADRFRVSDARRFRCVPAAPKTIDSVDC